MPVLKHGGFLDVDGVSLEYQWFGPAPDEALSLVFLHEGLGCVELWRDFPERVAEATGCGVLVYSRAGYGRSDLAELPRPLNYMHIEGLEILPKVLDAAGVRDTVLVGHSDGGSIALINAGGLVDERIRGLVLMAPHVFNEQVCVDSIRTAKQAYEETNLREQLARYHGDNVDCAFWGWNKVWLDPGFWQWNIEEFLPTIKVPVMVLQGEDDEYGTAAQLDSLRSKLAGPIETQLIPHCRHLSHRDQPVVLRSAIVSFMANLLDPSASSTARGVA